MSESTWPVVVNCGGGVNSTALLVGMHERGQRVDLVLFSDTGGERQETYEHVGALSAWLAARGMPQVTIVHRGSEKHASLEQECLNNETLPSLVFGYRSCSAKWKRDPMDKFIRHWDAAKAAWGRGDKVRRLIGIDAGEPHRGRIADTNQWVFERPLIDWDWGRDDCIEAIERAGLAVPPKSACFFCPASKKREVLSLARESPELFARAVALERAARDGRNGLSTVKGLGRNWSWEELASSDAAQQRLFEQTPEEPCMCFDGGDE